MQTPKLEYVSFVFYFRFMHTDISVIVWLQEIRIKL